MGVKFAPLCGVKLVKISSVLAPFAIVKNNSDGAVLATP